MILEEDPLYLSPSYFWSCITLSEDCPFFSNIDPKLRYFGLGIALLYGSFFLVILGDLEFFWSLDNLQHQIDYYINLVTKKVRRVQKDQRRLMSIQERTEKQLKRSQDSKKVVTSLRAALSTNHSHYFTTLTGFEDMNSSPENSEWSHIENMVDY